MACVTLQRKFRPLRLDLEAILTKTSNAKYGIVIADCSIRVISWTLSYSMVVLYIRDHAVLGFLAQKYHPKIVLGNIENL